MLAVLKIGFLNVFQRLAKRTGRLRAARIPRAAALSLSATAAAPGRQDAPLLSLQSTAAACRCARAAALDAI